MIALGCLLSLAFRQAGSAALLVGVVWIFEFAFREGFATNSVGQYLLIFMQAMFPTLPALPGNELVLLLLAGALLLGTWALLKKQERYI
jgi:hypothetical protein